MKANYALAQLGVGFLLGLIGALMKSRRYPNGDALRLAGLGCEAAGAVTFLAKLINRPSNKDFLNY